MATLIALLATAIESSIDELVCEDMLVSYEAIVQNEVYAHHPWNFVPGILKVCHLPQVAAMVCPRPLRLSRLRDANKESLPAEKAIRRYTFARDVYAASGRDGAFTIE